MIKQKDKGAKAPKGKGEWVEGGVQEFLSLSDADMELIETRLAASRLLKVTRQRKKLTQAAVAAALHTSQSRLAKMESGDPSVSLDLLFKSLFSLGITRQNLASNLVLAPRRLSDRSSLARRPRRTSK
jgi:DNA-binding XRE family transcriptional regulator